jgi:hypothetical protein
VEKGGISKSKIKMQKAKIRSFIVLSSEFIGELPATELKSGEMERRFWINLKKQRQTPAFGWKY